MNVAGTHPKWSQGSQPMETTMECPHCSKDNPADARFCNGCGKSLDSIPDFARAAGAESEPAQSEPMPQEGERKQATVLFSDLSGYTAMNERLDPEDVRELMARLFGEVARIVEGYGGTIEKYIGDAVMAIFGVPTSHEDDPLRAVRAALDIHQAVAALSPPIEAKTGHALSMHTGINTGLVVTGRIELEAGTLGVVGDAVNLAARLSGLAGDGEVVVGQDSLSHLERYFTFDKLPSAQVKGKAEAVEGFRLSAPRDQPAATHRFAGLRSALVGRQVEFALLQRALDRLRDGKGSLLSFRGEAGSGKSRLIEEFRDNISGQDILWFMGKGHDYTRNIPYYPLKELLSQAWKIQEGDTPEQVREKLESNIRSLLADTPADPASVIPYVGGLYALEYAEITGSPEFLKQRLFEGMLALYQAMARKGPSVFILEDLHWADPSTLELLRHIIANFGKAAITLFTYRPPFQLFPGWDGPDEERVPGFREIDLESLSPTQTENLTLGLLEDSAPPPGLVAFIQDKAAGNPFYVEEVLTSLIESQAIVRENGIWRLAGSLDQFNVPSTVQGLIAARLDRLEPARKRLLQEAAVIGRNFLYQVLTRITGEGPDIAGDLGALERLDMIRAIVPEPDLEYMFKHPLTQEVVYGSLLHRAREVIHDRIGHVMEDLLADRLPEYYERLSFHFRNGRSSDKAVDYLIRSGEKALNRFALDESDGYFQEALQILAAKAEKSGEDKERILDILITWALVFYYRGEMRALHDLLRSHEQTARTVTDPSRKGMFLAWLGFTLYYIARSRESIAYLSEALEIAEAAGDRKTAAYVHSWIVYPAIDVDSEVDAVHHGEQAMALAREFQDDHYLKAKSGFGLAFALWWQGETTRILEIGQEMLAEHQELGNVRGEVLAHWCIGLGQSNQGDLPASIETLTLAKNAAVDPFYRSMGNLFLSFALMQEERFDLMETVARELLEYSQQTGSEYFIRLGKYSLGTAIFANGRMGTGMAMLQESVDLFKTENLRSLGFGNLVLGILNAKLLTGGKDATLGMFLRNFFYLVSHIPFAERRAVSQLTSAVESTLRLGFKGNQGRALIALGELHAFKKRTPQARECFQAAIAIYEETEAEEHLSKAREALAVLG